MPATRTDSTLGTNFTQATLVTALKSAMTSAGFSAAIDDYTSGTDRIIVYPFVTDSSKVNGTTFFRIRVTSSFVILATIFSTWTVSTHTGTNPSTETSFTALFITNTVNFVALNGGTEYKFVLITQGSTIIPLGVIAPTNKPTWWSLDNWNYAFIWNASNFATVASTALNPYANTAYTLLINNSLMATANSQTDNADILTGLILFNNSGRGIAGKTSDDLGSACVSGAARYSTIPADVVNQNFLVINPVAGGLVIKTA